jgi:ribosomal protein S9
MAEKKDHYYYALGRRKSATARVRLFTTKGDFIINQKSADAYFASSKSLLGEIVQPFNALELDPANYSVSAKVEGGGHASQVDAIKLALATTRPRPTRERAQEVWPKRRSQEATIHQTLNVSNTNLAVLTVYIVYNYC